MTSTDESHEIDDSAGEPDASTAIVGKNADDRAARRKPATTRRTFTLTQLLIAMLATALLSGIAVVAIVAHYEGKLSERPAAGERGTTSAAATTAPGIDLARNEPGDPLAIGDEDAPVVMVEYSDYRCPYCALWARDVKPELMKYVDDGTLRIEHHDLPIFGEESVLAAIAGRAAGNQGMFWEYYDALHAVAPTQGHPSFPKQVLLDFAAQVGIPDMAKFEADMNDPALQQAVIADAQKAMNVGATSTPVFLINGEPVMGAQPAEVFIEKIEKHAAGK